MRTKLSNLWSIAEDLARRSRVVAELGSIPEARGIVESLSAALKQEVEAMADEADADNQWLVTYKGGARYLRIIDISDVYGLFDWVVSEEGKMSTSLLASREQFVRQVSDFIQADVMVGDSTMVSILPRPFVIVCVPKGSDFHVQGKGPRE